MQPCINNKRLSKDTFLFSGMLATLVLEMQFLYLKLCCQEQAYFITGYK